MPFDLEAELAAIVDAFEAAGIDYAVCGALAVAMHGFPHATMDIGILIDHPISIRDQSRATRFQSIES